MTDFVSFGDPARFEIALRWSKDREPRERLPEHAGWSTGEMRLTVGNHPLTRHVRNEQPFESTHWYLFPVFEWLAKNWIALVHEERFAWRENTAAPAATAVFLALRRQIDADDELGQAAYGETQAWWMRHALRAADSSALYPDVVVRRLADDVEISWTARQPSYAPRGFRLALSPGAATMSVADFAEPLWQALEWVQRTAMTLGLDRRDEEAVEEFGRRLSELRSANASDLEKWYLPTNLFSRVKQAREINQIAGESSLLPSVPAIAHLNAAVLMFGGVNPDIGKADVQALTKLLTSRSGVSEPSELAALVGTDVGAPLGAPFEQGYDLAEELLDTLSMPGSETHVDIRSLLERLGIVCIEQALKTSTIRGVAIAGEGYTPTILINKTSDYNSTEAGKRFTLAHELCHVLYDRVRARRIAHVSGPWTSPGVEKRANAFAAMFLMPRALLRRLAATGQWDRQGIEDAAATMQVGVSALVEHLFNTNFIDEFERDALRLRFGSYSSSRN